MGTNEAPLSYSSVRTYLECPLRWKFLYVDGLKEAPKGYFSFGRTIHQVLEELLRPYLPGDGPHRDVAPGHQRTLDRWELGGSSATTPRMSLDALLDLYRSSWISEGYASPEEEERYRRLGAEILGAYWMSLESQPPAPIAVEQHLEATWDGIRIHGYLDRLDRRPTGGIEIVDYKTSRELTEDDVRQSDQLGLYQVLVERTYREPVEALTLYHLRQLRPITSPPRSSTELDGLFDRVGFARDGIRSHAYEPTPGRQCPRCEFQARCPEFRSIPESERARVAELVDRFARLRDEEQAIDRDLQATARELHEAAERFGVHRFEGSSTVVKRHPEAVWQFPSEWLTPLLEEHGLGARVPSDDPRAVGRLLRDRTVPAELRARLGGAGGRKVRWYWEIESGDRAE